MNKEKKYIIECTEVQLRLIANCVEDCHRFSAGQPQMWNTLLCMKDWRNVGAVLQNINLPEYDWAGNGCENNAQRKFIAQTYPIYREILHFFALERDDQDVYYSETLTCEEGGEPIKIKVKEEQQ